MIDYMYFIQFNKIFLILCLTLSIYLYFCSRFWGR